MHAHTHRAKHKMFTNIIPMIWNSWFPAECQFMVWKAKRRRRDAVEQLTPENGSKKLVIWVEKNMCKYKHHIATIEDQGRLACFSCVTWFYRNKKKRIKKLEEISNCWSVRSLSFYMGHEPQVQILNHTKLHIPGTPLSLPFVVYELLQSILHEQVINKVMVNQNLRGDKTKLSNSHKARPRGILFMFYWNLISFINPILFYCMLEIEFKVGSNLFLE